MLHNAKDSIEKLAPVAHQHVSAPSMQTVPNWDLEPVPQTPGPPAPSV